MPYPWVIMNYVNLCLLCTQRYYQQRSSCEVIISNYKLQSNGYDLVEVIVQRKGSDFRTKSQAGAALSEALIQPKSLN